MLARTQVAPKDQPQLHSSRDAHQALDRRQSRSESTDIGLVWRLTFVLVGFTVATIGWLLIMTVLLSFIGLPLFIVGAALMQAQER